MPEASAAIRPLITHRAVMGEGADSTIPAHYGAPLREQRRLLSGTAVVDLGNLEILEVGGADRLTWLTTITSQVFTGAAAGDSLEVTVLSPQGRVEHWAQAIVCEDCVLLLVDAGAREGLRSYLTLMMFASRITLTDRNDLRVLGSVRPPTEILAEPVPVAMWSQGWPRVAPGGVAYGEDPEFPEPWHLGVYSRDELEASVSHGTLTPALMAGMSSAEAVRVLNHRPRFATEVDERTIPHELDLLRTAVHTAKGCYRGQETVAKVLNLGQPPRRLVRLHLDGSHDLPVPTGASVLLGAKEVGRVTTSVLHADEGPVALAVIRRAVPLDAALRVAVQVSEDAPDSLLIDATQVPIVRERVHGARPATTPLGHRGPATGLGGQV